MNNTANEHKEQTSHTRKFKEGVYGWVLPCCGLRWVLNLSLGLGLVMTTMALYDAFDHNPQGDFFDPATGKVNIPYSLLIFISWFLVSSIVIGIIGSVITFLAGILIKVIKSN